MEWFAGTAEGGRRNGRVDGEMSEPANAVCVWVFCCAPLLVSNDPEYRRTASAHAASGRLYRYLLYLVSTIPLRFGVPQAATCLW